MCVINVFPTTVSDECTEAVFSGNEWSVGSPVMWRKCLEDL